MSVAFTPADVKNQRKSQIPDEVIRVWNGLLVDRFKEGVRTVIIKQSDAVYALVDNLNVLKGDVFTRGWLDIEAHFQDAGWNVRYDKPAYYESYEPYFEFTPKEQG